MTPWITTRVPYSTLSTEATQRLKQPLNYGRPRTLGDSRDDPFSVQHNTTHMDNQHKQIKGYRDLSQEEIDAMNKGKELAAQVGAWIDSLHDKGAALDQRAVALGKTNLQQGFMWAIRGIAQPTTF